MKWFHRMFACVQCTPTSNRMPIFQWYSIIYADVILCFFAFIFNSSTYNINIYHYYTKCQVHLNFQINRNVVMKIVGFWNPFSHAIHRHWNIKMSCAVFFFSWLNMFDAKKFSVFQMEKMWTTIECVMAKRFLDVEFVSRTLLHDKYGFSFFFFFFIKKERVFLHTTYIHIYT